MHLQDLLTTVDGRLNLSLMETTNETHAVITSFDGEISTVIGQITTLRAMIVAQYKANERAYARKSTAAYAKYLAAQGAFEDVKQLEGELAKIEALYACQTGTWYPGMSYNVSKLAKAIYAAIPAA